MEGHSIRFVAIYIRKSRAETDEDLAKHRMVLTDLCKKLELKSVEYAEVGTSDSIDMRPKMSRLLKEVENGDYDAVCVIDIDRLSRGDGGDQDRITKIFRKSNTLILTPDKIYDLNNDTDSDFAEYKSFFARQEYKMISKRLRQGKKTGARRGDWTNGTPPFPYEYERWQNEYRPKSLVVNQDKLKIYRKMVEDFLSGVSIKDIAISLNKQNILSPRKKTWSGVTVGRILIDETHLGHIISNKTQGDGHAVKKPSAKDYKRFSREDWTIVEGCHEAVKTQDEHDRILAILGERKKVAPRARQEKHCLSGLVKCAKCGHSITFYMLKKENRAYMKPCWYTDPYGVKCINQGINTDKLEEIILNKIKEYKNQFVIQDTELENKYIQNLTSQIEDKKTQIFKIDNAIETVNESYELGDYTRDEWIRRKTRWGAQLSQAKKELYELEIQLKSTQKITSTERLHQINEFLGKIEHMASHTERNRLYKTIIREIIWLREGNDIKVHIEFR